MWYPSLRYYPFLLYFEVCWVILSGSQKRKWKSKMDVFEVKVSSWREFLATLMIFSYFHSRPEKKRGKDCISLFKVLFTVMALSWLKNNPLHVPEFSQKNEWTNIWRHFQSTNRMMSSKIGDLHFFDISKNLDFGKPTVFIWTFY